MHETINKFPGCQTVISMMPAGNLAVILNRRCFSWNESSRERNFPELFSPYYVSADEPAIRREPDFAMDFMRICQRLGRINHDDPLAGHGNIFRAVFPSSPG